MPPSSMPRMPLSILRNVIALATLLLVVSCGVTRSVPFPVADAFVVPSSSSRTTTITTTTNSPRKINTGWKSSASSPLPLKHGTIISHTRLTNSNNHDLDAHDKQQTQQRQPHIVILGGGFGGINTALTLPTLPWRPSTTSIPPRITLIDKSERFVFLPLLYELCVEDASLEEVAPTFQSLLKGSSGGGKRNNTNNKNNDNDDNNNSKNDAGKIMMEDVSFVRAQVEGINVENQQVVISHCSSNNSNNDDIETIRYDALVIATGSEISLDAIPGGMEYALPFYTVEQCLELKRRLALLDGYLEERGRVERLAIGQTSSSSSSSSSENVGNKSTDEIKKKQVTNVVVVGGGYSGVELALNLVDRLKTHSKSSSDDKEVQVTLVHRGKQVLEYATEHNRNSGVERLKSAGVNVLTSTSVMEVMPWEESSSGEEQQLHVGGEKASGSLANQQCIVKLSSKLDKLDDETTTLIPTTLLLWTAGATPTSTINSGISNSLLPRDIMGRIITSPTLNVPEYPNVFAIGDCSRSKKVPYPGTAQVAMQQATVAAWNVYATLSNNDNDANAEKNASGSSRSINSKPVELLPFNFVNLGEMMTLGTNDATISTLGGRVELGGPAASWLRRWIYAVRMPTLKQGLVAVVDGTERKLARGLAVKSGSSSSSMAEGRRSSKPVDWK